MDKNTQNEDDVDLSHSLNRVFGLGSDDISLKHEDSSVNLPTEPNERRDSNADGEGAEATAVPQIEAQQDSVRLARLQKAKYQSKSLPPALGEKPITIPSPFPIQVHTPVGSPTGNMDRPIHHPKPRLLLMGQRR